MNIKNFITNIFSSAYKKKQQKDDKNNNNAQSSSHSLQQKQEEDLLANLRKSKLFLDDSDIGLQSKISPQSLQSIKEIPNISDSQAYQDAERVVGVMNSSTKKSKKSSVINHNSNINGNSHNSFGNNNNNIGSNNNNRSGNNQNSFGNNSNKMIAEQENMDSRQSGIADLNSRGFQKSSMNNNRQIDGNNSQGGSQIHSHQENRIIGQNLDNRMMEILHSDKNKDHSKFNTSDNIISDFHENITNNNSNANYANNNNANNINHNNTNNNQNNQYYQNQSNLTNQSAGFDSNIKSSYYSMENNNNNKMENSIFSNNRRSNDPNQKLMSAFTFNEDALPAISYQRSQLNNSLFQPQSQQQQQQQPQQQQSQIYDNTARTSYQKQQFQLQQLQHQQMVQKQQQEQQQLLKQQTINDQQQQQSQLQQEQKQSKQSQQSQDMIEINSQQRSQVIAVSFNENQSNNNNANTNNQQTNNNNQQQSQQQNGLIRGKSSSLSSSSSQNSRVRGSSSKKKNIISESPISSKNNKKDINGLSSSGVSSQSQQQSCLSMNDKYPTLDLIRENISSISRYQPQVNEDVEGENEGIAQGLLDDSIHLRKMQKSSMNGHGNSNVDGDGDDEYDDGKMHIINMSAFNLKKHGQQQQQEQSMLSSQKQQQQFECFSTRAEPPTQMKQRSNSFFFDQSGGDRKKFFNLDEYNSNKKNYDMSVSSSKVSSDKKNMMSIENSSASSKNKNQPSELQQQKSDNTTAFVEIINQGEGYQNSLSQFMEKMEQMVDRECNDNKQSLNESNIYKSKSCENSPSRLNLNGYHHKQIDMMIDKSEILPPHLARSANKVPSPIKEVDELSQKNIKNTPKKNEMEVMENVNDKEESLLLCDGSPKNRQKSVKFDNQTPCINENIDDEHKLNQKLQSRKPTPYNPYKSQPQSYLSRQNKFRNEDSNNCSSSSLGSANSNINSNGNPNSNANGSANNANGNANDNVSANSNANGNGKEVSESNISSSSLISSVQMVTQPETQDKNEIQLKYPPIFKQYEMNNSNISCFKEESSIFKSNNMNSSKIAENPAKSIDRSIKTPENSINLAKTQDKININNNSNQGGKQKTQVNTLLFKKQNTAPSGALGNQKQITKLPLALKKREPTPVITQNNFFRTDNNINSTPLPVKSTNASGSATNSSGSAQNNNNKNGVNGLQNKNNSHGFNSTNQQKKRKVMNEDEALLSEFVSAQRITKNDNNSHPLPISSRQPQPQQQGIRTTMLSNGPSQTLRAVYKTCVFCQNDIKASDAVKTFTCCHKSHISCLPKEKNPRCLRCNSNNLSNKYRPKE